ncbi:hypothetical protein pb186bvf_012988 [Paramecium bursaria]
MNIYQIFFSFPIVYELKLANVLSYFYFHLIIYFYSRGLIPFQNTLEIALEMITKFNQLILSLSPFYISNLEIKINKLLVIVNFGSPYYISSYAQDYGIFVMNSEIPLIYYLVGVDLQNPKFVPIQELYIQ